MNGDVLISGASVAGPALAYWLRRYGFNPTVVERAPALREGGYAVDIRGAALDATERMGILAEVRQASTSMRGMSYVDDANRRLASMRADLLGGSGVVAEVEILRGDLTRILAWATRGGSEYVFNDSITDISQVDDHVNVTFEHGEPRTFDLVVGADGLHSNVRTLVFGDESRFIRDLGYYVAIFTVPNHLDLDHWELFYNVPGKLAGMYSARDNTEAKALFYFASPPLHYDRHDTAQQQKLLLEAFAGEGWEVPRLLEAMWDAPDFYFDSVSQIHMDSWSNGRAVLVGDAAYCASPMSGQGTSLALVGAYVLAGELGAAAGDHRTALARYEQRMRGYVERNQKSATRNAMGFVPRTRWQIWFRNQNVRALPYLPWKGVITGGPQKTARAITLDDYRR
jgi:2-polyprenyl-6-methoxyphenol hydroxylase-like FAD-dependent oxidoreductase